MVVSKGQPDLPCKCPRLPTRQQVEIGVKNRARLTRTTLSQPVVSGMVVMAVALAGFSLRTAS
jgi:hypothetical protein